MTQYAQHLIDLDNPNLFPGLVALERRLGHAMPIRLGSNECLEAAYPSVQATLGPTVYALARAYSDPQSLLLREALARHLGVDTEELVVDAGADALLTLMLRTLCNVGDTVICSAGTYPTFRFAAQGVGCRVHEVPYRLEHSVLSTDLAALAHAAQQHHATLVYLANPDNPTGGTHPLAAVEHLIDALPESCTLLLDEAYFEFSEHADTSTVLTRAVRIRSFSKAYALAGLRIGYAIAPAALIQHSNAVRIQFAVSAVAQVAALAALNDQTYKQQLLERTVQQRQALSSHWQQRGLCVQPSATNFVALTLPNSTDAERAQHFLLARGIAIHRPPHPALAHLLRVTVSEQTLSTEVLTQLDAALS